MALDSKIKALKERIDKKLGELELFRKKKFYHKDYVEALKYPLVIGGKRTRPIITLLLAESGATKECLRPLFENFALAIEFIHTYSLVHDDLPSMDNDTLRRGHPTSHVVYGEAKALLIGDALLTAAFELLSDFKDSYKISYEEFSFISSLATKILSQASGLSGMVYGQWCDLSFENSSEVSWEALMETHIHKTGKLMAASFQIGVLCLLISNNVRQLDIITEFLETSSKIGEKLGLSFQIIDDILDVTQDEKVLGKSAKKDINANKLTAVKVLGLEVSQDKARELNEEIFSLLESLYDGFKNHEVVVKSEIKRALYDYIMSLLTRAK